MLDKKDEHIEEDKEFYDEIKSLFDIQEQNEFNYLVDDAFEKLMDIDDMFE